MVYHGVSLLSLSKTSVYTKKMQVSDPRDIPCYITQKHCISSIYLLLSTVNWQSKNFIVVFKQLTTQHRSQGPLSTSRKYPGCGWSRAYVNESNPHRGWILDLILPTLSMEVKGALLFIKQVMFQRSCLTGVSGPFYSNMYRVWVWDADWEGSLFTITIFLNDRQQPASDFV